MKHIKLFTLCTLGILGFLFFGCDKVEGPYGINNGTTPTDTTSDTIIRKVLLEDFTGHTWLQPIFYPHQSYASSVFHTKHLFQHGLHQPQ